MRLCLLLIFLLPLHAVADTDSRHSVGTTLSNISGYGFYYDLVRTDNYVFRPVGLIYYLDYAQEEKKQKAYNYTIGTELQKRLARKGNRTLYFILGAYYYHDDGTSWETASEGKSQTTTDSLSVGTGIGFEHLFNRLVFSFHVGLKAYNDRIVSKSASNELRKEKVIIIKEGGGLSVGFLL